MRRKRARLIQNALAAFFYAVFIGVFLFVIYVGDILNIITMSGITAAILADAIISLRFEEKPRIPKIEPPVEEAVGVVGVVYRGHFMFCKDGVLCSVPMGENGDILLGHIPAPIEYSTDWEDYENLKKIADALGCKLIAPPPE